MTNIINEEEKTRRALVMYAHRFEGNPVMSRARDGGVWTDAPIPIWQWSLYDYELAEVIEARKPEKRVAKCWNNGERLIWITDTNDVCPSGWKRVPSLDMMWEEMK